MTQKLFKLARFGLLAKLSGRISTGSSFSASRPTISIDLTTLYHFLPHLSCKLLIVKSKLEGVDVTKVQNWQSTTHCG